MPERSRRDEDENETAFRVVGQSTARAEPTVVQGKNPAAVALGRLGGLKGGKARAKALSAKRRKQIARRAALVRWEKRREAKRKV
jgi:hypothetical protein